MTIEKTKETIAAMTDLHGHERQGSGLPAKDLKALAASHTKLLGFARQWQKEILSESSPEELENDHLWAMCMEALRDNPTANVRMIRIPNSGPLAHHLGIAPKSDPSWIQAEQAPPDLADHVAGVRCIQDGKEVGQFENPRLIVSDNDPTTT